jgi:DNA polymerase III delta prime subunit
VIDDLAVDAAGQWCALETCDIAQRQQGKGAIIETIELAGLFLFREMLILHSAHEYKTAQEAFLRIRALIDGSNDLTRYVKAIREANGEQQIILMSGARLRFVARSKGSGRGFSAERNILDEAYALTRTQLAALLPTMSAQPNPQVNMFTTVPDAETMPEGDEAVLPGIHKRALAAAAAGRPGRLCYHDHSIRREELPKADPVTDEKAFEAYIELAYQANPAMGIRISEDYVRGELAALGASKFAVERLGLWLEEDAPEWQVFHRGEWFDCKDEDSAPQDPVAFALIVSEDLAWTSVCVAGQRADGMHHVEVAERQPGTSWAVPWMLERHAKWKPCRVVINKSTPAGQFVAPLTEAGIEVTTISTQDAAAASGALLTAVESKTVRHRGQGTLNISIARAARRNVAKTWELALTSGTSDVSPAAGCAYALWGYTTRAPAPQPFFASVRGR